MSVSAAALAKAGALLLSNEKTRSAIGWIAAAVLSPVILLVAFACVLGSGASEHNQGMIDYCFYGVSYDGEIPDEIAPQMQAMRNAFSTFDTAVASVNSIMETGCLDPIQVKALYYVLSPNGEIAAGDFIQYFFITTERTRTVTVTGPDGVDVEQEERYTVAIANSLDTTYRLIATSLGREITEEEKADVQKLYNTIAGTGGGVPLPPDGTTDPSAPAASPAGGGSYAGGYGLRGTGNSTELSIEGFTDPYTKNAHDLVVYATHAWENQWGYVWGTFGEVLTNGLFQSKLAQFPDGVGSYAAYIQDNWVGGRTADCAGLIKGYGWMDPDTLTIRYGANGMPDLAANNMYYAATVKGPIDTIPEVPGLAVWADGHIGIYVGGGMVIEASSTKLGVIKTRLSDWHWTHWLEIPNIRYD